MLKRVILFVSFLSTFSLFLAQHEASAAVPDHHTEAIVAPLTPAEVEKQENKDFIDHHILDAHSFDIMVKKNDDGTEKHIGFPLPVIFYDQENGLHTMMSSAFHHGTEMKDHHGKKYKVIESKGSKYALYHEKIYKTNADGTFSLDDHGHPINKKMIDFSITKSVLMIIITSLLMIILFTSMARGYKKSAVPTGAARLLEPLVIFIRDEIAKPNIGAKYKKYVGYLLTIFFFILILNIFGLMPFGINVTGQLAVTAALAIFTFLITQFTANKNYWQHIFWMPGLPFLMKLVMIPIELIGMFIKPFALLIRLFANMTAGHIVVMSLIAMIYVFKNIIGGVAFPFLTFVLYLLEILVAFLQAYIFTMLSAVYFGMANEEHHHEGDVAHH